METLIMSLHGCEISGKLANNNQAVPNETLSWTIIQAGGRAPGNRGLWLLDHLD